MNGFYNTRLECIKLVNQISNNMFQVTLVFSLKIKTGFTENKQEAQEVLSDRSENCLHKTRFTPNIKSFPNTYSD